MSGDSRVKAGMLRVARGLRDLWLVFGVALVFVVLIEAAYRGQSAARRAFRDGGSSGPAPAHPYASEPWWAEWRAGGNAWSAQFDPYRGVWGRPGESKFVNLDSLGRRWTYDPAPEVQKTAVIWMFGGSTMFGYTARDRYTIPSLVAEELARRGRPDIGVVNLAQSTYNVTQDLITLLLELRSAHAPDFAVFLDGNNDIGVAFHSGRPGSLLNEDRLANRLGPPPGLADVLVRRLRFVQRLQRVGAAAPVVNPGDASLCPEIASQVASLQEVARGLGREVGFQTMFFWQPMLATTGKPLTPWERSIPSVAGWHPLVQACTRVVRDTLNARGVTDYYGLGGLFDGDTASVFIDDYGHITEAANRVVADAIVEQVMNRLPGDT